MSILQTIESNLKEAMSRKDELTRDTLRMLKSSLVKRAVELGRELSDDEAQNILRKEIKSRTEAAEQYSAGDRQELADRELAEVAVIEKYLPSLMDEEATSNAIDQVLGELGISEKKDMGRAMGAVMKRFSGQIDGKIVQQLMASKLH